MLVAVSYAIVDEDAVVIESRYTMFAYAAVFRSRWFQELASAAFLARMEDCKIIRIE